MKLIIRNSYKCTQAEYECEDAFILPNGHIGPVMLSENGAGGITIRTCGDTRVTKDYKQDLHIELTKGMSDTEF